MSLLSDMPIGILRYLYLPKGVPNVVSLLDSSSSLWLKNELVLSMTEKNLAPFRLCRTSSTNLELCLGLMIHLFRWVGSRQSLILPLPFSTQTKEFSHSISSECPLYAGFVSLTSLSSSAFKGSCIV